MAKAYKHSGFKNAADSWLKKNSSLVLRQSPRWTQSLTVVFIAMGTTAVLAGVFFRIDEVITVQGQLVSSTGNQDVKTPVGGKVQSVFFKDGEAVRRGQLLMKFDTRQAADQKRTLTEQIKLENQNLVAQIKSFTGKELVLKQKVHTQENIVNELKILVENGGYQRVQYWQQRDQLLSMLNDLNQIKSDSARAEIESKKTSSELLSKLRDAEIQLQYQNVVAPIGGIIFDPKARPFGVLSAGQTIVSIVPQEGLKAKINIQNKDIGFVKTGLKGKVRVDAFPFTRYGELEGVVNQIGADALPPDASMNYYRFPIELKLNRNYLKAEGVKIPLRAGMAITVNLKLREKRLISILSDLLVNQTDSIKSIRQ